VPVSHVPGSVLRKGAAAVGSLLVLALAIAPALAMPEDLGLASGSALGEPGGHLVISELLTGASSASDELIEIYNPTAATLPLEGLELVYVTASGATITRKAAWALGAAGVPPGAHVLVANEGGAYAPVADVTYAGGLAAAGGSVALRIQGASSALDTLGWGTATSSWLEGTPAVAPPSGSSLERLPGGAGGSAQDTDDNLVDFVARTTPDPQNSGSPAITGGSPSPSPSPSPTSTATSTPSVSPTPTPTVTPTPTPTVTPTPTPTPSGTIADVRLLPNGTAATIVGVALSDSTFSDGGGYLADASGGIAVLLADGAYTRGDLVQVSGVVDDRYEQRTLRATSVDLVLLGIGSEPGPMSLATGSVGESAEGQLVSIDGAIGSSATQLSTGVAYDLDDGSGPIRVLVGSSSGIDTAAWQPGASLTVVGVVGQRDATGTGTSGYRVQPRDAADIGPVTPAPTVTPSPTPSASETPVATPTPTMPPTSTPTPGGWPLMSIAQARQAAVGTGVRVRGVVTAPSGLIDPTSAVLQDASGGIVVRLADEAGRLARGQLVELSGVRSTKSGMLTLRVSSPPTRLGTQAEPVASRAATGQLGEALEAQLVVARGVLTDKPRRSSAGSLSFGIDDGTGEIRVFIGRGASIESSTLVVDAWVEIRGVLGQETSGTQPDRGYRIWPRDAADVRLLAAPVATSGASGTAGGGAANGGHRRSGSSGGLLPDLGSSAAGGLDRSRPRSAGPAASGPPARRPLLDGRDASSTPAANRLQPGSPAGFVRADEGGRSARLGLGLLLLATATLLTLGAVGWRIGGLERIQTAVQQAVGRPRTAEEPGSVAEPTSEPGEPLPRLTVMRLPQEPDAR